MRAVVQRVTDASVSVSERVVGEIGRGVVVLLGVSTADGPAEPSWMADKISHLRIFSDDEDKMNLSLIDVGGEALVISQFTLMGDARKGRRPSFVHAARGEGAESLYEATVAALRDLGVRTATGEFGAMMAVRLVNDGPVTLLLDSGRAF